MAVFSKVGSFNTGTGAIGSTVVVSGIGFQPKVIFFWWNGRTDTTDASGRRTHQRGFGAACSTTDRRYVTSLSQDTPTAMLTNTMQGNAACIGITTTADAIDGLMDVQSIDSGGFTLVVDDVFTASYTIQYLALGGNELTDAVTGQFTGLAVGNAGLNQDITGLSFQPECVLAFSTGQTTANNTVRADSRMMMSAAVGSGVSSAVWAGGSNDGAGTSQAMSYCKTSEFVSLFNTGLTGLDDRATFSSFLSTGFRINWTEIAVGGAVIFYVALKGCKCSLGTIATRTDTTQTSVIGMQQTPKAFLLVSACKAESTADTPQDDDEWSIGAFTGASARQSMTVADDDAAGTAIVSSSVSSDSFYLNLNANTGAVEGEMDVVSVGFNDFTVVMTDTDPSAAFIWYLAFGQTANTKTLSGGATPSGTLSKSDNKLVAGEIFPSGSILKSVSKFFSGALTSAGDLIAEFIAAGQEFFQSVSGGITPSGALTKIADKILSGEITPTGAFLKQAQKVLAGAISSIVGTLEKSAIYARNLSGNITPSGSMTKTVSKFFSGTLTSSGALLKAISKFFTGSLATVGDLTAQLIAGGQTFFQSLSGSITPTGQTIKNTAKTFAGAITSSGALLKSANKVLTGSINFTGNLLRGAGKNLQGLITPQGTLAKLTSKLYSGNLTSSGSISKQSTKSFSGEIQPTGFIDFIRLFVKMLEGTMALAGTISKSAYKNLQGIISPLGTLNKLITKTLSGVLSFLGTLSTLTGVAELVEKIYLLGSLVNRFYLSGSTAVTTQIQSSVSRVASLVGRARHAITLKGKRDID